ncbi:DUF7314 family protein [Halegenticoccus tardaugens]|uniref:DUF7314 family protein n=1 Tax=Halegenticoccus tardaugens TaxID=2071624 RepID=UPI00100B8333|nr:hypothetical protein [Halegenticoccus tardaugens]
MADEFIKGLGIFTGAGLAWMVLAGWYQTESFESTKQLIESPPEAETLFDAIAIPLIDVFLWFALLGALTFWILIPAGREARRAYNERKESS